MHNTVMFLLGLLLLALFAEPLAERIKLPFSALLVLIGFLGSELVTGLGIDTGFRWHHFNTLILHVLVPILVFESAFNLSLRSLLRNLLPVLFLAIPAMLLASAITGIALYYVIGYPQHYTLIAALLTGVILSATDPVAVVALFKKLGAPERLNTLLEGESLFNDATAVVLFTLLSGLALMPEQDLSLVAATFGFLTTFVGGALTGLATGALAALCQRFLRGAKQQALISLGLACATFLLAEHWLHVSGIVAVLCCALVLGERHRRSDAPRFTGELWELNAYLANACVFLLVGVTITWPMFSSHWLAMLIGIVAASLARAMNVYLWLPLFTRTPGVGAFPGSHRHVMMWGGLRGAVSLALALSLPTSIDSWFTIQSIVYGVVLFTLFVQAPLMPPLIRRCN